MPRAISHQSLPRDSVQFVGGIPSTLWQFTTPLYLSLTTCKEPQGQPGVKAQGLLRSFWHAHGLLDPQEFTRGFQNSPQTFQLLEFLFTFFGKPLMSQFVSPAQAAMILNNCCCLLLGQISWGQEFSHGVRAEQVT